MITREGALEFLNKKIENKQACFSQAQNKNIIKHMLACEAMMCALAGELKSKNEKVKIDEEEWGMAGLLHDGDYSPEVPVEKQGIQITDWLREKGYEVPENVAQAMAAHNWHNNQVEPKSQMDWALFCGDSLTGLIVAATLVLPSRKLSDLTVENVLNRFKEKSFAKGTRREDIVLCEEKLGIPLEEFIKITLSSMQSIASELGL